MTIINKMLEAMTNVIKSKALKVVPLITHMHAWAERAETGSPCHAQPPAHLNGQGVSTRPNQSKAVQLNRAALTDDVWSEDPVELLADAKPLMQ